MVLFAALMVGLAMVGSYRLYSPVPFCDTWSLLDVLMKIQDGHAELWWSQHNEHRLLLTQLLLWADLTWFGGFNLFLMIAHYVLVVLTIFLFWRILRGLAYTTTPSTAEMCFGLLIAGWLFFWSQWENFWFFAQSQVFLAVLLPLCAFYFLHHAVHRTKNQAYFLLAALFGLASTMSMASGVFVLPLMVGYALLMRERLMRVIGLVALTVISLILYFDDYHSPAHHVLTTDKPMVLMRFVLIYLGNPFYFLLRNMVNEEYSLFFSSILGAIFLFGTLVMVRRLISMPRYRVTLQWALMFFIFYGLMSACAVSVGRSAFGWLQAVASRYTTFSIVSWAALFILFVPDLLGVMRDTQRMYARLACGLLLVVFLMSVIYTQFFVFGMRGDVLNQPTPETLFKHKVAMLGEVLGVDDFDFLVSIFPRPWTKEIPSISQRLLQRNLSVFGLYPFREARKLNMSFHSPAIPTCQAGQVKDIVPLNNNERFVRVSGWLYQPQSHPRLIRILNHQDRIVGYALPAKPREKTDYMGYVLVDQLRQGLVLQGDDNACRLPLLSPSLVQNEANLAALPSG